MPMPESRRQLQKKQKVRQKEEAKENADARKQKATPKETEKMRRLSQKGGTSASFCLWAETPDRQSCQQGSRYR